MSREKRFGDKHIPPTERELSTLAGVFSNKTIHRLVLRAEAVGISPSDAVTDILTSYPEKGMTQLAAEAGTTIPTMQAIFDFFGVPRLPIAEMRQKNKDLGKGIFGLTAEQRSEIGKASGEKTSAQKKGVHGMTREERSAVGRRGGKKGGQTTRDTHVGIFGLTAEQRKRNAANAGKKSFVLGVGAHGIDQLSGRKRSSIGGNTSYVRGVGIHVQTTEQRQLAGIQASEVESSLKFVVENNYFDSAVEATVGKILEVFIPHFTLERGKNFQVIIAGAGKKVDFKVGTVLVEYNPIILKYLPKLRSGFDTLQEEETYKSYLWTLPEEDRCAYIDQVLKGLKQRYFQKRRDAIDADPHYRDTELVIVTNPAELFTDVIVRFGENYLDQEDFVNFFDGITRAFKNKRRRTLRSKTNNKAKK